MKRSSSHLTSYKVFLSKSAVGELISLDKKIQDRIKSTLKILEKDPFQTSLDIKKVISNKNPPVYRIRVGDYRATYSIIKQRILISKIFNRKKGYKWME